MDSNAAGARETKSYRGNEPSDGVLRVWPCIMSGRVGCLASAQLIESRPGSGTTGRNKGWCVTRLLTLTAKTRHARKKASGPQRIHL